MGLPRGVAVSQQRGGPSGPWTTDGEESANEDTNQGRSYAESIPQRSEWLTVFDADEGQG